jgi:hypothetical protein
MALRSDATTAHDFAHTLLTKLTLDNADGHDEQRAWFAVARGVELLFAAW